MAKDFEQALKDGRKIQDLLKSEGWQILEQRIKREIKDEDDLIRSFPIEERALQEIAAEYLEHRSNLNAYQRVLEFVQEFLSAKEEAEGELRK